MIPLDSTASPRGGGPPVVAVWRSIWLPPSETFILNQVTAMQRWRPLLVGVKRARDGLPVVPDYAPYGYTKFSGAALRLNTRLGLRVGYDRVLRKHDVSLIHAHFGFEAVKCLPVARRLGLPLIATFHGTDVTRAATWPGEDGISYRRGLQEVFRYASRLLAVSEFIAGRLVDLGAPAQKIQVQPIGVPVESVETAVGGDGVVFVGRLIAVKGVSDLISAVSLLPDHVRGATRLVIVGDGELAGELRAQARAAGVDARFIGVQSPVGVAEALSSAAVFVGPSRTAPDGSAEGFGLVYLEAALRGLPVVAYRHGGVPEAVEHEVTGLLVAEGDTQELANAIEHLLVDSELRHRLGSAGRARVLRQFDVGRRTAEVELVYDDVVDEWARVDRAV